MKDHLLNLTAEITINYIKYNNIHTSALPPLITNIHSSLIAIMQDGKFCDNILTSSTEAQRLPIVHIKKSFTKTNIICLECGKSFNTLKRHLRSSHDLSPHEYRKKWGLAPDYPMITLEYSQRRSKIAKDMALGVT